MEDTQPLMGSSSKKENNREQRFLCYDMRCGIIFIGFVICLDLIIEIINVFEISSNDDFAN